MVQVPVLERRKETLYQALKDGRCISIQDIFTGWDRFGVCSLPSLRLREFQHGTVTLPGASLVLIYQIASQLVDDLSLHICIHRVTYSAQEAQIVLPQWVLVQKTVTVALRGKLLLWTSIGDRMQTIQQRRVVATTLSVRRQAAKHTTINPPSISSEEEFGMAAGMVSPFLPPLRRTRPSAVVQEVWPRDQEQNVATSLSLYESLILPVYKLCLLLNSYIECAYVSELQWIELDRVMAYCR
jgi:hypothetical protein